MIWVNSLVMIGVVERKYRHIVETGLTLLFHAHIPHYLSIDAFATSVFLLIECQHQF